MANTLTFDFTPDPRVLIALTQTPIMPLDALCELIDNSIDSFSNSRLMGKVAEHPMIWIDLPKKSDLDKGFGVIRIRDNGPGMTTEQAEKAIKAGYSGNNSIDTLGLFGMGFNISTGKLGIKTRFTTARLEDDYCTKTTIDLEEINSTRSYQIQAEQTDKPLNFESGTQIEINKWWPEGHANHGFVYKLVGYGSKKIKEEIGRRYATILRKNKVQIFINNEPCIAFEHCVWGSNRSVVHKKFGSIPARYDFNHVLATHRRCIKCRAILHDGETVCPSCGSTEIRTIEERISGWVGIQRFDDPNRYGIDLIRNGRAIKIGEKTAFFDYVDEFQNVIKDYPIDSPYGRIVGEVNMDFVPVDFLKQDFQRSSEEWLKAITFLRGDSSLQPKQEGADKNDSYIYKLYQGYRKVRTAGTTDMYMGYWDAVERCPKRISRDVEREYYEKFLAKEPGYFDDSEWWKLVESASIPPVSPMVTCPECGTQNLAEAEVCSVCNHIFKAKKCIQCGEEIPLSSTSCPKCGASQTPKVESAWKCNVCGTMNPAGATECKSCHNVKGSTDPLSETEIMKRAIKDDELSIKDLSINLVNGQSSIAFSLETYYVDDLQTAVSKRRLPLILFKSVNGVRIIIDKSHPMFVRYGVSVVDAIASEVASYIYDVNRTLSGNSEFTISNISWQLINTYWGNKLEISEDGIKSKSHDLITSVKEQIAGSIDGNLADRLFSELTDQQQKLFVNEILNKNIPLSQIEKLKEKGNFISYVPDDFILHIFDVAPELFFDGKYWNSKYAVDIDTLSPIVVEEMKERTLKRYRNALECVIDFLTNSTKDIIDLRRVESALAFLNEDRNQNVL